MGFEREFDVVVVGGGHAGVEAAAASARIGASTALLTQELGAIGAMSCNPAFGGLGKGHLVREIDALDGIMGKAADRAAIQYRLLNQSKGPAVQGPRVQADRRLYRAAVRDLLLQTANLTPIKGECLAILLDKREVCGLRLASGEILRCGAVVIATGTFLNGIIHRGVCRIAAGRLGEPASHRLSGQFTELGFRIARLKTGTPPRIDGRTICYSDLEPQWGDETPAFMSALTDHVHAPQTSCHITRTTPATHEIVRKDVHKTAVYSGAISGRGPRYCPSIEDKVVRFPDRDGHQVFLEPEGLDTNLVYPNGISTSLPEETQEELIKSIPGMEQAKIVQFGYAIEYDYVSPTELFPTLMTRRVEGLFFAGQINGTTGYEEAGAQGIVAGINAARHSNGLEPHVFDRTGSYIGVLIDDLVTRDVTEPYRMFTSRSEFRLALRSDNADERLTPVGVRLGVVGRERTERFEALRLELDAARQVLTRTMMRSSELAGLDRAAGDNGRKSLFEWATSTGIDVEKLLSLASEVVISDRNVLSRLNADAKYRPYIERQKRELQRQREDARLEIPFDLDLDSLSGLSNELKNKFRANRPLTLAHAGRYEGVTPAALLLLAAHARRSARSSR